VLNASFGSNANDNYFPPPFLSSPEFPVFAGRIAFNYPTAEFRIDLTNAPNAPFKLSSTLIQYTGNSCVHGQFQFNCTATSYITAGRASQCWKTGYQIQNMPNQMGANLGLQYEGYGKVDGVPCMVWKDMYGYIYDISLSNLAVIEIDLPFAISSVIPYFNLLGRGQGTTYVRFSNIVVGTPDPSNFSPPTYQCKIQSTTKELKKVDFSNKNMFKHVADTFLPKFELPTLFKKREDAELQVENVEKRQSQFPPSLNQVFTADYIYNVSQWYYGAAYIKGRLAFDFTKSGFAFSIDSIASGLPFNIQSDFRVYPSFGGFEFLEVSPEGNSYGFLFLQWFWSYFLPQFQLSYASQQVNDQRVNGDLCTVWQNYGGLYFVRKSDNTLVQINYQSSWGTYFVVTLSNVKGTVDPSRYAKPSNCVDLVVWNRAWQSHLPYGWCFPFC